MGVFTRISDLMKANINDLIDRAEDPEKMIRQIIRDIQNEVAKSTQALGNAMASERISKKQYDEACAKSAAWEEKAKAALTADDTETAKKALANKVKADADVANFKEMYNTISNQKEVIRDQMEVLTTKLEEAKARQKMIIARSQMADTQKNLAKAIGGFDPKSHSEKLARLEEKIEYKEAQAQAFTDISLSGAKDNDEFARIENDLKVDAELERLRAELGLPSAVTGTDTAGVNLSK